MINNRQNGNGRRGRGRNNNNGIRPMGGGNQDRGNRIDNRARGNASQLHEKYKTLARDAQMQGDRVMTEYYHQFADHYFRVLAETRGRFDEQRPRSAAEDEFDGEGGDGNEAAGGNDERYDDQPRGDRGDQSRQSEGRQNDQRQGDNGQQRDPRNDQSRNDQLRGDRDQRDARNGNANGNDRNDAPRGDRDQRDGRSEQPRYDRDQPRDTREPRNDQPRNDQPRGDQPREPRPRREREAPRDLYRDERPVAAEAPVPVEAPVEPVAAEEAPRRPRGRPRRDARPVEVASDAPRIDTDRLPPSFLSESIAPSAPASEAGDGEEARPRVRRVRRPRADETGAVPVEV